MKNLQDRVAVVTGAGSGIGRATALALANQGCRLALVDVNPDRLQAIARDLSTRGVDASTHQVDVSSQEQMRRLVEEVVAHHGQVHILVNNAGVVTLGTFEEQSYDDLEWIVGINLWGVVHGCKLFLPHLKQANEAHIVNISSAAGILASPRRSSYALTKFAVRGLSESLRQELAPHNIGVTCVFPGIIRTNISKATRYAGQAVPAKASDPLKGKAHSPDLVAEKIARAIQDNRARVLVGSETYFLDLGKRLLPAVFDRIMARYLGN